MSDAARPDGATRALREVVGRFDEVVGEVQAPPRDEIRASWERCVLLGLQPERFVVPYDADIDAGGRLSWAACPVINRVAADLEGTPMGLLLTDQRGHVLDRRTGSGAVGGHLDHIELAPGFVYGEDIVGTNAIGTAIQQRDTSVVQGPEHFADALVGMACTAVCVSDPATGQLLGVVDLTCAAGDVSPLMLPLAKRVAWEIEQRLFEDSSVDERMLRERFLSARRTTRAPLAVLNERTLLANTAAATLVHASDRELIWNAVVRTVRAGRPGWSPLALAGGRVVTIRSEAVLDGVRLIGAVVHFGTDLASANGPKGLRAPGDGWSRLTRAEQAVAEQVALGMTNAEAAARLYVSPHTIDFHLRQVFRKLDVRSRVELTRALVERQVSVSDQHAD